MSPEELAIWRAAYGAAYAVDALGKLDLTEAARYQRAEYAVRMADDAVAQLALLRSKKSPTGDDPDPWAGILVRTYESRLTPKGKRSKGKG